jgi:uncharacterized protein YqeY
MGLKETLVADIKTAMLARDTLTLQTLQGVTTAITYEEVAKKLRETGLDDTAIEQIIARESKKRDESAELFDRGGNHEAAEKERAEKVILQKYLPQQLSEDEIRALITGAITQTGATEQKDMGRVIGAVKAKAGNAADGALVAKLTREALQ